MLLPMAELLKQLLQSISLDPRDPALGSVAELEEAFGTSLNPEATAWFLAHQGHHLGESRVLFAYDQPCFPVVGSPRDNLFAQALRGQLELIAAFTGSMVLGNDGGGQDYFIGLEAGDEGVAIYGPGVGELRPLADSLESFVGLLRLDELWDEYAEANDIDTGEVIEGDLEIDLSSTPGLAPLAELLSALRGRVHLPGFEGTDVCSEFDELVGALADAPLLLSEQPGFVKAHQRAYPLMRMLDHGGLFPLGPSPLPDDWHSRYADTMYWLWRSYFQDDDKQLLAAIQRCSEHPARLIRDAAAMISSLVDSTDTLREWDHLRVLRQLVLTPGTPATEPAEGYEALLVEDSDDDATRKQLKALLRKEPTRTDAWDNLTFQFYSAQQWEPMQRCAGISAALRPEHDYAWMQLGVAHLANDRPAESLPFFDRSLCFSSNPNLWLNKALAWLELDRRDLAVATLRQLPAHSRAGLIAGVDDLAPLGDEVEAGP